MKKLNISISTTGERIFKIKELPQDPKISYSIIHQSKEAIDPEILFKNRNDINYIHCTDFGLSKSRNIGINSHPYGYTLIMDDDVSINKDECIKALKYISEKQCNVLTCQFAFPDNSLAKKYPKKEFNHTLLSAAKVSSIEIIIDNKSIIKNNVVFDEEFGLGTANPSGEEYIFLTDCIKKNLTVVYAPFCIGIHPRITSGHDFFSSEEKILAKKHMLQRIFKKKSKYFIFFFWIKKIPIVLKNNRFIFFTKNLLLNGK